MLRRRDWHGGLLMLKRNCQGEAVNVDKQKDWEVAYERKTKSCNPSTDCEVVRRERKISDEAEQGAAHQKREQEYIQRIAKLEKFAEEKVAESKASEIFIEEVTTDCKWLLARAIAERIAGSEALAKYMYELGEAAYAHGRKEGYAESKGTLKSFDLYKTDCAARYAGATRIRIS
ncbi:hypothetical protein HanPSC8_Chr08g0346731 [Helianthus annuus]|nr:hypothetical protein HanPSC8_Chr08g0346731 [Helianthus annuus]